MPSQDATNGNDVITATSLDSSIFGLDGDDTLSTGDIQYTELFGGAGDDIYLIEWESHHTDNLYDTTIAETGWGGRSYGSGSDTIDISAVASDMDNFRLSGDSYNLYIHIFDDAGQRTGTIFAYLGLDYGDAIETLVVGETTIDLTQASTGADLNGILVFGATAGDDYIVGDDLSFGIGALDGDDTIQLGTHEDAYAMGGAGDDVLYTDGNSQRLYGGDGDDVLHSVGFGSTTLRGGDGEDLYLIDFNSDAENAFNPVLVRDNGNDDGTETDTIDLSSTVATASQLNFGEYEYTSRDLFINVLDNDGNLLGTIKIQGQLDDPADGDQIEKIILGDDTIDLTAYESADELNEYVGALNVSDGDDTINVAGSYLDIEAGDGDDVVIVSGLFDTVRGGNGDDTISGDGNYAALYAGDGDDFITVTGVNPRVYGSDGDDTLALDGDGGEAYGGQGSDTYEIIWSSASADDPNSLTIREDLDGTDIIDLSTILDSPSNMAIINPDPALYPWSYDDPTNAAIEIYDDEANLMGTITLTSQFYGDRAIEYIRVGDELFYMGGASNVDDLGDELTRFTSNTADSLAGDTASDILFGYGGNDTIDGNAGWDSLYGDAGTDQISGGGGNDRISGGTHADIISGDGGNDVIYGDHGADTIDGGDGTDAIQYLASGSGVTVDLGTGTGSSGQAAGDVISGIENINGSRASDHLTGDDGDNKFIGYGGWDTLEGGDGDDRLEGWAGHDVIMGGDGNDILMGGKDNDTLDGGAGDDTLSGGTNRDVFVFTAGTGDDTVTDFNTELDTLDLSATTTDFTDTASVEAAASEVDGGVLIDLGGGDSVLLEGLTLSDIADIAAIF